MSGAGQGIVRANERPSMTETQLTADRVIPEELSRSFGVIGLRWLDGELLVGVADSMSEESRRGLLQKLSELGESRVALIDVDADSLAEVLDTSYRQLPNLTSNWSRVDTSTTEGPIAELVTTILDHAVRLRASDVHFEPLSEEFVVRARVDGRLEQVAHLPGAAAGPVVSRLKVLAQMNIVERRRPQDGQFSLHVADKDIDVRLATIATLYGEKAVARLLDTRRDLEDVEGLGLRGEYREKYDKLIHSQYGLIAVVGPTGAGKTTTLHSAIRELNRPDRNVATLEDPVEYVVEGVNHIPVVDAIGVGFATQLRGLLRQDPDIILVGEMRDEETARIGIQAALAGRLVLTSFHATDAVSAIYRLLQMGIEPHLVAASLRGVIAQRLMRRICPYCRVTYSASSSERLLLQHITLDEEVQVARGLGCTMCRGTGYRGRIGIFQILEISDELRELISMRPNPAALYSAAIGGGLRTLSDEAYLAALAGETTVLEASQLVGNDV